MRCAGALFFGHRLEKRSHRKGHHCPAVSHTRVWEDGGTLGEGWEVLQIGFIRQQRRLLT